MLGTCSGCGAENVEVNEENKCQNCAAAPATGGETPATGGDMGGSDNTGGGTPAV